MREYIRKLLKAIKSPALGRMWQFSAGERKRIALLSILNVFSALLSLLFTLIMRELVDAAVAGNGREVAKYAILMVAAILTMIALGYARRMIQLKAKTSLLESMRAYTLNALMHKRYRDLQHYHSGELVNRIFSDVSIVADGIVSIVPPLLYLLIQLVGASIILFRMSSTFMLILLFAGLFGALASFAFRHKMKAFHKESQAAEDKLHARIQETLGNLSIIRASGTADAMQQAAERSQHFFTEAQMRRGRFSALMGVGLGLVFQGSWLYALLWGCVNVYQKTLTYGALTAILQLVGQIQSPFEGMISTLSSLYSSISSMERLIELFDLQDGQDIVTVDKKKLNAFREIQVSNLQFAYDEERPVLKGISLTLGAGDRVALTGESGCGKSTLFSLLLGIYEPKDGSIEINLDGKTYTSGIRGLFAYVPQGNALFSGSIRENIAMFCVSQPSDEQIMSAARTACIDDLITRQENGLDAMLGEHGIGISEGQAQRIAIARAVMMDSPVLLLDESTSALDEQTEARLLANLKALGKTCIIVTHRRAALDICTKELRISDGMLTAVS